MPELRVKIPDDLKEEVEKNPNIEWSKVVEKAVRKGLENRARKRLVLSALDKLLEDSELTEEDALRLGEKVKEDMYKKLKQKGEL